MHHAHQRLTNSDLNFLRLDPEDPGLLLTDQMSTSLGTQDLLVTQPSLPLEATRSFLHIHLITTPNTGLGQYWFVMVWTILHLLLRLSQREITQPLIALLLKTILQTSQVLAQIF